MGATAALTPDRVLRRLEWHVVRRLDGRLQGEHRTTLRGHGTDYLDLRDYEDGDDVRHIDWNVSARMDSVFVREFTEDRELTGWLLIDRSASMTFGPIERTKELVGTEVATTFAQLLVRGGNRVAAILYDNDVQQTIPPRQGRNQVLILLRELLRSGGGNGSASGNGSARGIGAVTNLGGLLSLAARVIRRRSLVVIVSDFISEPGWEQPLRRLASRHEVVAIRLIDRSGVRVARRRPDRRRRCGDRRATPGRHERPRTAAPTGRRRSRARAGAPTSDRPGGRGPAHHCDR